MFRKLLKNIIYQTIYRKRQLAYKHYTKSDELDKFQHLVEAVNYIRVTQQDFVMFEFGCHSGRTFSALGSAAKFLKLPTDKMYAFDSFEGLPVEENSGIFTPGEFSTSRNSFKKIVRSNTGIRLASHQIIEGFYSESLSNRGSLDLPTPTLVHIDVDLYGSTVDILNFLEGFNWKRLLIIFDDWYCFTPDSKNGERLAFEEFLSNNLNIRSECWKNYSTFGKSFFLWRE